MYVWMDGWMDACMHVLVCVYVLVCMYVAILFLFEALLEVVELIVNTYDQTSTMTWVFEKDEYGGTYDRPWISSKIRFLNDHGDTIQHGR